MVSKWKPPRKRAIAQQSLSSNLPEFSPPINDKSKRLDWFLLALMTCDKLKKNECLDWVLVVLVLNAPKKKKESYFLWFSQRDVELPLSKLTPSRVDRKCGAETLRRPCSSSRILWRNGSGKRRQRTISAMPTIRESSNCISIIIQYSTYQLYSISFATFNRCCFNLLSRLGVWNCWFLFFSSKRKEKGEGYFLWLKLLASLSSFLYSFACCFFWISSKCW